VAASKKFGASLGAALDAGCGPGGTALKLCEEFKAVEAYDYSQGFVDMMLEKRDEKVRGISGRVTDKHAGPDKPEGLPGRQP
jgi:ubiquinone/menaquinone biosynthesis C-methylase UbiE